MKASVGDIVKVDTGDGPEYGLLVANGDDKDTVIPLGAGVQVGYREPEDLWHVAEYRLSLARAAGPGSIEGPNA